MEKDSDKKRSKRVPESIETPEPPQVKDPSEYHKRNKQPVKTEKKRKTASVQ